MRNKCRQDSLDMDFLGANRQFDWMEISLVYDKSDKRTTICNSYNVQMASKRIKSARFTKFTKIYSLTNEKKIRYPQPDSKTSLYKQFVAWSCNGSNVAPLSDYMNNTAYQELNSEDDYFDVKRDQRLYLDLKASSGYVKGAERLERNDSKISLHILLKKAATKN